AGFLGQAAGTAEEQAKNFRWGLHKSIDSRFSTHLYSSPNTDPDRTPLTKAKGQIPQKEKIHK
ncbi:hypothetical protein Tco_0647296, partial [Tanacetum coccineum]